VLGNWIKTREELDQLPVGTVLIDVYEAAWQSRWDSLHVTPQPVWSTINSRDWYTNAAFVEWRLERGPAMVAWVPS
jgi:hypothetical protein